MPKRNIMINKVGCGSADTTVNYRVSIPAGFIKALGVTPEDREVDMELVGGNVVLSKKKIVTQEDRIKSMSTEELAEFFDKHFDCIDCPARGCEYKIEKCKKCFIEWLQSKVEEG